MRAVAPTPRLVARTAPAVLLTLAALASVPAPALAQAAPEKPPETVADEFQRALESMVWDGAAQRIHSDALGRFHEVVTMLVGTDPRGEVREKLLGGVRAEAYPGLDAGEVFRRVMTALMDETPGLMHALVTRRHEVLGSIHEGPTTAHVVYRILPILQGAEPEIEVMTLERDGVPGGPWKVLRSEELEVVRSALRGIPLGLPVPPPPDTGAVVSRPPPLHPGR